MNDLEFYKEMYRSYKEMYRMECAETERLRGIIARNCDPGEARVLSGDEDAKAISKIQEEADREVA